MNSPFTRKAVSYITVGEMNEHLDYVNKYFAVTVLKDDEDKDDEPFGRRAFIRDKKVYFELTYKRGSKVCTYKTRKDGSESDTQGTDGGEAFRIMSKYYKVPRVDERYCGRTDEGGLSASPILYFNPKYEGVWVDEAYGYDMNSAYAYAMLQPIPDTSVKPRMGIIGPGEIGFTEELNPKRLKEVNMLTLKESGFAMYIFPLMESPFKTFVERWYAKKEKSASGSAERAKAKGVLNYSVGYLQRVNPFIRACIVGRCNKLIEDLIDEDTLFCNTDSICSRRPLDLKLGDDVGEWRLEHHCKVAYKGFNYQWGDGDVSYRSIPKKWMPKGWDITKDPPPKQGNLFEFDGRRLVRSVGV